MSTVQSSLAARGQHSHLPVTLLGRSRPPGRMTTPASQRPAGASTMSNRTLDQERPSSRPSGVGTLAS